MYAYVTRLLNVAPLLLVVVNEWYLFYGDGAETS